MGILALVAVFCCWGLLLYYLTGRGSTDHEPVLIELPCTVHLSEERIKLLARKRDAVDAEIDEFLHSLRTNAHNDNKRSAA